MTVGVGSEFADRDDQIASTTLVHPGAAGILGDERPGPCAGHLGRPDGSIIGVYWITNTIAKVKAATRVWKTVSHRARNPTAMLTTIHTPAALTTSTETSGLDAYRSILDSHRLTCERAAGGPWSATESLISR